MRPPKGDDDHGHSISRRSNSRQCHISDAERTRCRGCASDPNHRPLRPASGAATRLGRLQGGPEPRHHPVRDLSRARPGAGAHRARLFRAAAAVSARRRLCPARPVRSARPLRTEPPPRDTASEPSAWDALEVLRSPSFGAMLGLGVLLLALFVTWVATAQAIYIAAFGYEGATGISDFATRVLTTPQGWWLIVVGCGVGFLFALVALCISVVSFPLMLDRHAGAGEAMVTSLRAVARNPVPMAAWGLIVAVLLVAGIAAVLPRPCRRHPAARARHLASLPGNDRARTQSAAAAAARRRASAGPPPISRPTCSRGGARTASHAAAVATQTAGRS